MNSIAFRLVATLAFIVVLSGLAGCAGTGPQQTWFQYLDYVNGLNGAD